MHNRSEKFLLFFLLSCVGLIYLLIAIFSEGTFDSGDGIQHYLISRYSWKHPELFLHHWGKPFFILISSPFMQFGLFGATVFNILCAVGSAFFCYKIARKLEIENPFFAILFLCFAPIYFGVVQSGLTEPFFGFILILCIYGLTPACPAGRPCPSPKERGANWKIFFSCILISFLPFIRTEGFLILPLFFILILYRRKYFFVPLLAFGTLIYSIAGYFFYADFLWILHQNPYKGAAEIYGKGEWYHFIIRGEFIWGLPVCLFLAAGFFYGFKRNLKNEIFSEETILIFGSFAIYFLAHTIFWWKGLFGSLGLIRVMAGIMPVSAIIALRGFNWFVPFIKNKKLEKVFFAAVPILILILAFFHYRKNFNLNNEEIAINEVAQYLKESNKAHGKIYFMHPYISVALKLDRYDRNTNGELWGLDKENYAKDITPGSIVIWDSHFGPNEGEIKLEGLLNNSSYTLLNKFPDTEFSVPEGKKFEVYAFERK